MGQRLVFKCVKGDKRFATIYYHWSGYTQSIYYEAAELVAYLRSHGYTGKESIETLQKMLLDYLEARGGGVSWSKDDNGHFYEIEEWQKRGIDPTKDISRNNGLLDITDKGMRNSEYWAEALEEFNFSDETFTNNEFYHEGRGEFEIDDKEYKTLPKWEPDGRYVGTIKWDDARDACEWFEKLPRVDGVILGVDEEGLLVTGLE